MLTGYVAALEICYVIVFDCSEYLSLSSADFLDRFLNVAVDHCGQLRVRLILPLERAWLRKFALALFHPRGSSLSAVEGPRLAVYNFPTTLDGDLRVIASGTVFTLASNDCTHSANLSVVVQHGPYRYSIAVLETEKQAKTGGNEN